MIRFFLRVTRLISRGRSLAASLRRQDNIWFFFFLWSLKIKVLSTQTTNSWWIIGREDTSGERTLGQMQTNAMGSFREGLILALPFKDATLPTLFSEPKFCYAKKLHTFLHFFVKKNLFYYNYFWLIIILKSMLLFWQMLYVCVCVY